MAPSLLLDTLAQTFRASTFMSRAVTLRRGKATGGCLSLASAGGEKGAGSSGGLRRPRETPGLAHPQADDGWPPCTSATAKPGTFWNAASPVTITALEPSCKQQAACKASGVRSL